MRHKLITLLAILKTNFSKYLNLCKIYLQEHTCNLSEISFNFIIICIIIFFILYYPLGALLTEKIDRTPDVEISVDAPNQSHALNAISYLINQQVNDKIWTPNLPFFFPAAILDNMPNYQLGILDSLSKFTAAYEKCLDKNLPNKENISPLYKAAVLLRYPGTIWMFSPNNKIKPVPSAVSQYRKARRHLIKYNEIIAKNNLTLDKTASDLAIITKKVNLSLAQSNNQLKAQIRENSSNWVDLKADDIFYYNQGKAYAYAILLKALGQDYKDIIVKQNQYQNWISLTKALEKACNIQPSVIRNGELSSMTAPNHLAYLNNYILRARFAIEKINTKLLSGK